jgi:hypothetical protein
VLALVPTPAQGRRRNLQAQVVVVYDALLASQLAAPAPIEAAYRGVVGALVAVLSCLNDQVAALEQQLAARFAAHRDAAIIRSQPGLGAVLGSRLLGVRRRPWPLSDGQGPQGLRWDRPGHQILGPSHRGGGPGGVQPATGGCLLPMGVRSAHGLAGCAALLRRSPSPRSDPSPGASGVGLPAGGDLALLSDPAGLLQRAAGLAGDRGGCLTQDTGRCRGVPPRRCWPSARPGTGGAAGAVLPRGQGAGRNKSAVCQGAAEGGSGANLFRRSALTVAWSRLGVVDTRRVLMVAAPTGSSERRTSHRRELRAPPGSAAWKPGWRGSPGLGDACCPASGESRQQRTHDRPAERTSCVPPSLPGSCSLP